MIIIEINIEKDYYQILSRKVIEQKSLSASAESINLSINDYIRVLEESSQYNNNAKGYERCK